MDKKTKLVKGISQTEWNKVRVWCIENNMQIGDALNHIISEFFKKNE